MKRRKKGRKNAGGGRGCIHCVIIQSSDVLFFFHPGLSTQTPSCCFATVPQKRSALPRLSLCLLRRQLTMEHSAGGDPDPLIAPRQPWTSQREDRGEKKKKEK